MRAALAFLTPLGPAVAPGRTTLRWFPPAGAAIGATVGVAWWTAAQVWPGSLVPAVLAVAADLALTGMLHMDGVADTADGLLAHLSSARRLDVMDQPDVGAFGVAATATLLLLRFTAFAALQPQVALVAGVWCASRSLMVLGTVVLPYARPGGLVTAFLQDSRTASAVVAVCGLVAGAALVLLSRGVVGAIAALVALMAAGGAVLALARVRIGGFTGDVLGAAAVAGETAALLAVAARW